MDDVIIPTRPRLPHRGGFETRPYKIAVCLDHLGEEIAACL
jgi:hypothetical protein